MNNCGVATSDVPFADAGSGIMLNKFGGTDTGLGLFTSTYWLLAPCLWTETDKSSGKSYNRTRYNLSRKCLDRKKKKECMV